MKSFSLTFLLFTFTGLFSLAADVSFGIPDSLGLGCTFPGACNYNSSASIEDGSCITHFDFEWAKSYGGSGTESPKMAIKTADGGIAIAVDSNSGMSGDKTSSGKGGYDYWLLKLDSKGDLEWQRSFGSHDDDNLVSVIQSSDKGYLLVGFSKSGMLYDKDEPNYGWQDFWVVKTDSLGNFEWQESIGGDTADFLFDVREHPSGGFVLAGHSNSVSGIGDRLSSRYGDYDIWTVMIDKNGTKQWDRSFGGNGDDRLYTMLSTDSGFLLGGRSSSGVSGNKTSTGKGGDDFWVLEIDTLGSLLWEQSYGGTGKEHILDMAICDDGGYLLSGFSNSSKSAQKSENNFGAYDAWVVRIDSVGGILWENTMGSSKGEVGRSCFQRKDGSFIISCYSESDASDDKSEDAVGDYDYWLVNLDDYGNIMWEETIGGTERELGFSAHESEDGEIIIVGVTYSGSFTEKPYSNKGSGDVWVLKMTSEYSRGCIDPLACNYNSEVHCDDGSCLYGCGGCTDSFACNYDSLSTIDDGSCIPSGCMDDLACNFNPLAECEGENCDFDCYGCIYSFSCNYNPDATIDDGSCMLPGCTDSLACNYFNVAECDDGSCDYSCWGCTDKSACNYDLGTLLDDGSCLYPGCDDAEACNYNAKAGCNDGNCEYGCYGCTYFFACNYDSNAEIDDGSCLLPGCIEPSACNYDSTAACDDHSCEYSCYGCDDKSVCFQAYARNDDDDECYIGGCMDTDACNYTVIANCDDGSCEYESCTSSIEEELSLSHITIYPNPNNGELLLLSNSDAHQLQGVIIRIYNTKGEQIGVDRSVEFSNGKSKLFFNPSLSSGLYLISIESDNIIQHLQLVVE